MPRTVCARTACYHHLRVTWQALTVLTVLCVALQLLGVVRQAEYAKVTGPADEQLPPAERQEVGVFRSISTTLNPQQRDEQLFRWKDGKNVDTTSARRLASTINRISAPNGHQLAGRVPLPSKPQKEAWVYQDLVKHTPVQSENPPQISPELSSKDEPELNPEVVEHSPSQNQNSDNMPRLDPQVDSDTQARNVLTHDESGACRPKNHIVFLKTHKTASSTILNMLYRYGDTRNLTFALPGNMYSQLYYPHLFMAHFVEGTKFRRVKEFHIMCNHMRFQGLEVRKVMPVDTFYFSILRNPVSMMESIFTYYKSIPAFQNFRTLTDFLLDGGRSFNASLPNNHYARNILTFDFGMDSTPPANDSELDKRSAALIAAVESNFHLVLISEYFDESMILLKHALCWTLEDIVTFRLNSRNEKSRSELSPGFAELVKQWNSLDWRLYSHFNATFWRRVDATLGRAKLQEEVDLLRARRAELQQLCLLGGGAVDPDKVQDKSLKPFQYGRAVIQGYNLRLDLDNKTYALCQRLIMPELQYTKALFAKQFPDVVAKFQAAKLANAKRLAAARRTTTTTRHSALKHNSPTSMNSPSHTKAHPQRLDGVRYANMRTLAKPGPILKSNAVLETQFNPDTYNAIAHNGPAQT